MGQVAGTITGKTVATVGETVVLEGFNKFRPSVIYLKWQKWLDGEYVDINIHKSKYKGSKNSLINPKLVLNDTDLEDGGYYRIKFKWTSSVDYSSVHRLRIQPHKETITIDIQPDQINGKYYVGEDVIIKASLGNISKILCMTWQKETENGSNTIDTSSLRFMENENDVTGEYTLTIENCNELDKGTYFLLAACTGNLEVKSNRIKLDFVKDEPTVCLKLSDQSQKVVYGNTITLQAEIKAYPVPSCIRWTRIKNRNKEENIDENEKYTIDNSEKRCPKLTIKNLEFSDNGNYTITVTNDLGSVKDNFEIKVEASQMIFISGPVVVSPGDNMTFLTIFTSNQNCLNARWFKIKKYSKKEIDLGSTKYSVTNTSDGTKIQAFEVVHTGEEDSAGYQMTIDDFRSNMINTFVDDSGKFCTETQGNFFRCFALQNVCADALRKVLDNLPGAFDDKIENFKKKCRKWESKLEVLNEKQPSSSKDLDVALLCTIIQKIDYIGNPKKGLGRKPDKNDIGLADDVERIRHYRNCLCHKTSFEIETNEFNEAALDIIWAIRRLSQNDVKMMEDICDIMNKVITTGEKMDEMIVQIKIIQKENNEWEDFSGIKEFNDDINLIDREMKFHRVSSSISIQHNFTSAFHNSPESGLCFMDRPLQLLEKVHIRGIHQACSGRHFTIANIGLTNINPDTIHESEEKNQIIRGELKPVQCIGNNDIQGDRHWWENFHLCITLCPNATLSLVLNDTEEIQYRYQTVSDYHALWLVIELSGFDSIWISHV